MTLAVGARLGIYEIVGLLGAGGMGEVYRARDTKLERDVAIKVLPATVAEDPDRLARFEREARLLASLNHPHIAQIYGLEGQDGQEGPPFIVMEFVDGETLAQRIARKPSALSPGPSDGLSLNEALDIARQIADALDAAHERGIVHRDLKPANIVMTPDGVVKVLDFGLAKGAGGAGGPGGSAGDVAQGFSPAELTNSPTLLAPTLDGVLLGTAPYMSPEQARGKVVDKRADIWAFGCVLYEMLSGRRAFSGETTSDTLAAILEREPDWTALPASLPVALRRTLQRCLAKEPRNRLRDIGDAGVEIGEVHSFAEPAVATLHQSARLWRFAAIGTALALAVGGVTIVQRMRQQRIDSSGEFTARTIATALTTDGTTAGTVAPDGRTFAFVSHQGGTPDIWLRQVSGGEPIRITNDASPEDDLAFSPNGETIYFSRGEGFEAGVWRVGLLGGAPQKILAEGRLPSPSPDGRQLAHWARESSGSLSLRIAVLDGSETRTLVSRILGAVARPAWSFDGRQLAFSRPGLFAPLNLFVIDIQTGRERQVTHFSIANEGITSQAWLPDNRHLVVTYYPVSRQQALPDLAILDADTGAIARLTMTVSQGFANPSVSADGSRLIATAIRDRREIWKVPIGPDPDASGRAAVRIVPDQGGPVFSSVSADRRVLLFNSALAGSSNLFTMAIDRSEAPKQITSVAGDAVAHSSMSPDGRRVAFASTASGTSDIWTQNVDGTALRRLTHDQAADSWPVWSPDGKSIVFAATLPDGRRETWEVPADGGAARKLMDGNFRGDWVRRPDGNGTWIVTGGVRLIDPERRSVLWEERLTGVGRSIPMFSPDRRSISVPFQEAIDHDSIYVMDVATRAKRVAVRLPFHILFRADWVDNGSAFIVNRSDTLSNIVLFDDVWRARP